ncbi:MAG: alpha/beta hydrolase [Ktedonobacteraceae bacterium]|nr:alpha/beta hydrolase [Ktedonobacteraceae bacterium]
MSTDSKRSTVDNTYIDEETFHADVASIESLWQRTPIGTTRLPLIDIGRGEPVVFVPILEHLEFVYARQMRALSRKRRVILYRRQETRSTPIGLTERAEELRQVLDTLEIQQTDLVGHGDAAMVLFEFALRYPRRCHSLTIIAQAADYRIAPHPFIWLLHELYLRLPIELVLPAAALRNTVIDYIVAHDKNNDTEPALPRRLIEEQFRKISQWPQVYKFSVLPVIHSFDVRKRVGELTMPVLLINRHDDALAPEEKTNWLAQHLPDCAGYHVIAGRERFFMYAQAETVTPLIEAFLNSRQRQRNPLRPR